MKPLTDRQQQVLDFIRAEVRRCGTPPTVRAIARHFGYVGSNAAYGFILALERKGAIKRGPRFTARSLTLTDNPPRGIPLVTMEALSRG